jgi:predicted RNase H-like HicB family nuclease
MSIKSTIIIQQEDNWYVATSIETGVASQGKTIDESISNLKEALTLYFEDNKPELTDKPVFITTLEVAV